jgi:hypothetical protein
LPTDKNYKLYVKMIAADGTTFTETYNIAAGTTQEGVRDLVYSSIPVSVAGGNGWGIQKSGTTGLVVNGYVKNAVLQNIAKVGASASGLAKDQQPAISGTSP